MLFSDFPCNSANPILLFFILTLTLTCGPRGSCQELTTPRAMSQSSAGIAIIPKVLGSQSCAVCDTRNIHLSLGHLVNGQEDGCPVCALKTLAVQKLHIGTVQPAKRIYITVQANYIEVLPVSERYENRPSAVGTKNIRQIEIFTMEGSQSCSYPFVGVRREYGRARQDIYAPVLSGWLQRCEGDHVDCKIEIGPLPTRVLDVNDGSSNILQLYLSRGERERYCALSHCWGGSVPIRTTGDSLGDRLRGIHLHDMPKTFQDAVSVTRVLGVRYLWIDSLYIIQDNKDGWEIESGNMASIHHGAYLFIGADMAANSESGFLKGTYSSQSRSVHIARVENDDSSTADVYARFRRGHGDICSPFSAVNPKDKNPLATRGWTLQEQLLSSRMVHFNKDELVWECRTAMYCECMEDDIEAAKPWHKTIPEAQVVHGNFRRWHELASHYHTRYLTYATDFLPALSGIATYLQDFGAGEYLAGIWKRNLPQDLLWSTPSFWHRYERVRPYRAPTWSWASLVEVKRDESRNGSRLDFLCEDDDRNECFRVVPMCRITDIKCTPAGKDPNGSVASGYVMIEGKVLPLAYTKLGRDLATSHSHRDRTEFSGGELELEGIPDSSCPFQDLNQSTTVIFDVPGEFNQLDGLIGLLVARFGGGRYDQGKDTQCYGLVLRKLPSGQATTVYERSGIFKIFAWSLRSDFLIPTVQRMFSHVETTTLTNI